jgi:hypothetical protein
LFFYLRLELLRNMGEFHEEVNLLDPYSFLNVQVADFEPVTTQCYAGFPTEVRGAIEVKINVNSSGRGRPLYVTSFFHRVGMVGCHMAPKGERSTLMSVGN